MLKTLGGGRDSIDEILRTVAALGEMYQAEEQQLVIGCH